MDSVIENTVLNSENLDLTKSPSKEEIKEAVFSMDASNAPGPDGFCGAFYQHCWNIVKADVIATVSAFFHLGHVPKNLNSNFIVIVPKEKTANSIDAFRPIVLGNFLFKIISKIIADRLGKTAVRIVSENQFGLLLGRQIQNCIALA